MQVLLVEPYHGGSHRAWAEGYASYSAHDVRLLTLPPRWWRWRMRGGAVTLAREATALAAAGYAPDTILVSDMIDLALFRSLLPQPWRQTPVFLYFHESQLTYPDSPQLTADLSYAFLNWTSALVADRVFFNSEYHRDVFFAALPRLLGGFPDFTHSGSIDDVRAKSAVLPLGVDLSWIEGRKPRGERPLVLWNHRWEHDKAPEVFFAAVDSLVARGEAFDLALCGRSFREEPAEFEDALVRHGDRIVQYGHCPLDEYRSLVLRADIVVSTARQEFFGVAVVEATAAGARPVLPDRLSYPSLIPERHHPRVLYQPGGFEEALAVALVEPTADPDLARSMTQFSWTRVAPLYDSELRP